MTPHPGTTHPATTHPGTTAAPPSARWRGPPEPTDTDAEDGELHTDTGRAIIEVIFLAVLMLIPVLYILISLLRLQAATFAVTQAARDAGRAIDTAPTIDEGIDRARQIAGIDLADQNIPDNHLILHFLTPGTDCTGNDTITPTLNPGDVYDICITAVITLPGVPTAVTGANNTVTGVYTLHIGDLREGK